MTFLGKANWEVTGGDKLNLIIAAVPASKDGAICSWRDSGAVAIAPDKTGKIMPLGSLSAFNDFGFIYNTDPKKALAERQYIENTFGISMEGYAGALQISVVLSIFIEELSCPVGAS